VHYGEFVDSAIDCAKPAAGLRCHSLGCFGICCEPNSSSVCVSCLILRYENQIPVSLLTDCLIERKGDNVQLN
jgi:hypothetical protein